MSKHSVVTQFLQIAKGKFARDFYVASSSNLGIVVVSSIGGILGARLLGPEGRGELAAAIAWIGILGIIGQLGLPQAITYTIAKNKHAVDDVFQSWLVLLAIQSVVIIIIGYGIASWVLGRFQPQAMTGVKIYLFSIPATTLITYLNATAQGLQRFQVFSLVRLMAASILLLSTLFGFLFEWQTSTHILYSMVLIQYILATGTLYWFITHLVKPEFNLHPSWMDDLLKYGLKSYSAGLSWIANARMDQFIMSFTVSLSQLGIYAVAVSYAGVLFPVVGALANVLFPHIVVESLAVAKRKIWGALTITLILGTAGSVFLGLFAPWLIPSIFGTAFVNAIFPARILLIGAILLGGNYVLSDALRGLGKPNIPSIAEVIGLLITLLGLFILLPRYGILGAAQTSIISYTATFIVLIYPLITITRSMTTN